MKTQNIRCSLVLCAATSLMAASSAHSADVTWDTSPGAIGAGDSSITGGVGTWDTSGGNWTTDGGANNVAWDNLNNDTAIFGGTAGVVTLGEAITVGGITFNTAAYQIVGGGNTLTLASGAILHSTVGTNNSTDPFITAELAGTNGFTKTGGGWLGLEATTSSLSGNIKIEAGTLYTRHEALGSGDIVFTGNSTLTKVYNANSNFTKGVTINDNVTAAVAAATFYYNANFAGVLAGGDTTTLNVSVGGNTEFQFNNTANTFTGKLIIGTGGTADNGGRAVFKSLADSSQIIQINNGLLRLANGGVSMNFANRQLEMLTNNARLDNDSTSAAVTMSFMQDLSVKTGNNSRILYLTGVNTGDNTFSGVIGNSSTGTGATQVRKQEAGTWILGTSNTYTGKTTVDNGKLVVASLKNIGETSSIGAGSTLQLGYYNTAGALRYVGNGDSTDRPVQLNDYTNGTGNTGSGIILNDGSGALTFTATTFIPTNETVVANRSLELGGSYTGAANVIEGTIQDIAPIAGKAIVSVIKRNDDSTWVLSGSNSYTGTTTINGGSLLINGDSSMATGAITVNSGILGGIGIHGGNVTVASAGTLAPGNSIGILSVGNLSFGISATYSVEVDGSSVASDRTNVTGTITIDPAATLALNVTGALAAGQKYFIVANDDVDGVTGTFAGLAQDGVVGTYGGVDLKISYTGDSGTSALTGGNDIVLYTEGGGGTPYETWAGPGVPFDGDANGDGVSNGLAFLLGAVDPDVSALDKLPTVTESAGGLVLTFDMLDAASRGGAQLHVEHSNDVGLNDDWVSVLVPDATPDPQASDVTFTVSGSGTLDVTATIQSTEAGGNGKLFGRLKAVNP